MVNDEENPQLDDEEEKPKKSFRLAATIGAAGVNAAAWIVSMVISGGATIFAIPGAAVGLFAAPVAVLQGKKLENMTTLRSVQNALRQEANLFQEENNELEASVDKLENDVGRVQKVEGQLNDIVASQGESLDNFMGLMKENAALLLIQEDIVQENMLNQILTAIIQCDRNQDFKFDDSEIDMLMVRVKGTAITADTDISDKKMRKLFEKYRNDIAGLMTYLRQLSEKRQLRKCLSKTGILSKSMRF
mmetsp:Transcript_1003/g.1255  ORF Transcript_1003/g.1255 Transcript_1003/m.1255 type:complete len:247 (+) Transcript_1003:67-807(+)